MSFILDMADYVAANTTLVIDTDLYIGEEAVNSPDECVTILSSPGSFRTESGLDIQTVQILVKGKSFISAEELSQVVYNLLANKPGFDGLDGIFYCEVLNAPYPAERDARGRYIFTMNFVIRKRQEEEES